MPFLDAKCPSCGAILKVDGGKDADICNQCGTAFVVEQAIHNYYVSRNSSKTNRDKNNNDSATNINKPSESDRVAVSHSEKMFCKNCGKEINSNTSFCPFCGSKIDYIIDKSISVVAAQPETVSKDDSVVQLTSRVCHACGRKELKKIQPREYLCVYCGSFYITDENDKIINKSVTSKEILELFSKADSFEMKNDYHSEMQILSAFESKVTNNIIFLSKLGVAYRKNDMTEEALNCYNKANEIFPFYAPIYNNIGAIHFINKEYEKALPMYGKAIGLMEACPNEYDKNTLAMSLSYYGATLVALGKNEEGENYISKGEALGYSNGIPLRKYIGSVAKIDFPIFDKMILKTSILCIIFGIIRTAMTLFLFDWGIFSFLFLIEIALGSYGIWFKNQYYYLLNTCNFKTHLNRWLYLFDRVYYYIDGGVFFGFLLIGSIIKIIEGVESWPAFWGGIAGSLFLWILPNIVANSFLLKSRKKIEKYCKDRDEYITNFLTYNRKSEG